MHSSGPVAFVVVANEQRTIANGGADLFQQLMAVVNANGLGLAKVIANKNIEFLANRQFGEIGKKSRFAAIFTISAKTIIHLIAFATHKGNKYKYQKRVQSLRHKYWFKRKVQKCEKSFTP
jgi:hypothetical protein